MEVRQQHAFGVGSRIEGRVRRTTCERPSARTWSVARGEVEDASQGRSMFAAASWLIGKRDRENYGEHTRSDIHVGSTDDTTEARLAALVEAKARQAGGGSSGDGEE